MASETLTNASQALSSMFAPRVKSQINRRCPALRYIKVVRMVGKDVTWTPEFSGDKVVEVFAEGSSIGTPGTTKKEKATLGLGNYRCPAGVSDKLAILAFQTSGAGAAEEMKLIVQKEVNSSIRTLTKGINDDIFVGTGTSGGNPNIVGLTGGACAATGIYAGLNRSTYSEWAGNELGNGGTPRALTDALLRQGNREIFEDGGVQPNLILTTAAIFDKFAGLFTSVVRVTTGGEAPPVLAAGTRNLMWGNCPVIADAACPAGTLIMLNTDEVTIEVPTELLVMTGQYPKPNQALGQGADDEMVYDLPLVVELLARTGNNIEFNVYTYAQLKVERPNSTAVITDISET